MNVNKIQPRRIVLAAIAVASLAAVCLIWHCGRGDRSVHGLMGGSGLMPPRSSGGAPVAGTGIGVSGSTVSLSTTGCSAGWSWQYNGSAMVCTQASPRARGRLGVDLWDDLLSATISGPFTGTTAAGTLVCNTGSAARPGTCILGTSTSAAANTRIFTSLQDFLFSSAGRSEFEAIGVGVTTLCDGTEDCQIIIGFSSTVTSAVQNGAYFLYDRATSAKWQFCVSKGGVTSCVALDGVNTHTIDRTVTVGTVSGTSDTGVVMNYKISCDNDDCVAYTQLFGTDATYLASADACASGCSVAATNIPTTGLFGAGVNIRKIAGTTARTFSVDAVGVRIPLAAGRVE